MQQTLLNACTQSCLTWSKVVRDSAALIKQSDNKGDNKGEAGEYQLGGSNTLPAYC